MSEFVFVYGTLRKGMHYHNAYMQNTEFSGNFRLAGFEMFTNKTIYYPYIRKGNGEITAELYQVPRSCMERLDQLEGVPDMYTREKVKIGEVEGWIYVFGQADDQEAILIESGDWAQYVSGN